MGVFKWKQKKKRTVQLKWEKNYYYHDQMGKKLKTINLHDNRLPL